MKNLQTTAGTRLKRLPERGHFDRETINKIIDDTFICHVGIMHENQAVVIPTICAREEDRLYIHGSSASRLLKTIEAGNKLCVTITNVDGLVLARSAFHHSLNYRSVVIFGRGNKIIKKDEKLAALKRISENIVPGRWTDVRAPNDKELKQTTVIFIPILEASAKVRSGPPGDDAEDYKLPVWAGVIPIQLDYGTPEPDPQLSRKIIMPPYLNFFLEKSL